MGFVCIICAQLTLYYCSQVAQLPAEKSDIFIQYLQDNIPPGVSLHMELVKNPTHLNCLTSEYSTIIIVPFMFIPYYQPNKYLKSSWTIFYIFCTVFILVNT